VVDKCGKRYIDRTFDASIIEKIRKLRAITERRGATEGEALAAEQRMFRLLAKYNLEISQIPDDEPTKRDTRIESESAQRPSSVWKQHIYTGVANLNFSECFHLAPAHRRCRDPGQQDRNPRDGQLPDGDG